MNMPQMSRPLSLAAVVLIALGLAWPAPTAVVPLPEATLAAAADPATSQADAAAPAPLAAPAAASAAPAAAAAEALLRYPDGATRPSLNGVTTTLEPSFTACVPFAPVVGTERDYHGLQWYVHENGTRSTSFLDARGLPFACAYMPGATKPVID